MASYKNKIVVITGAGKGIGKAIAKKYAAHEAELVLIDKEEAALAKTEKELIEMGAVPRSFVLDLTDTEKVVQVFEEIKSLFARVDVLISNAGVGKTISPYELSLEDWDYVLNTNLRGSFLCSREAAKLMRKHQGGSIVMISSTRALMSEPHTEAYAASKGGILALTHALAMSLGPHHITVNAISPGWIETGDYSQLRPVDHVQHPVGRVGKVEDVARACLFLTDPENSFVTGTNLVVDGGMTRKMIYAE